MIPKNIEREHILEAIKETERVGVPVGRGSKKFCLEYNGRHFPPKYIVSLANKYANGEELDSSEFSGGNETNDFLRSLGFKVVCLTPSKKTVVKPLWKTKMGYSRAHHDERCPKCKEIVKAILERVHGEVVQNYRFEIGTLPENFKDTQHYGKLTEIYKALQDLRGFKDFVRAITLPNCDFFMPDSRFILEFDESQHFTLPRRIALEQYPKELALGFDRKRWIDLCKRIDSKDNDPPYRDEQRAWYDTLRDFLPELKGLKPTARIFAKDFEWCSLDPENPSDVERFNSLMKRSHQSFGMEVREDPNPFLARVIITREWDGNLGAARRLLSNVYEKWPRNTKVKFLVTCGGFLQFDWPVSMSPMDIGDNKYPKNKIVNSLAEEAMKCAKYVTGNGLGEKLGELTDYLTLGVDSHKEKVSTTQNYISQPHVELVILVDLKRNRFYWTGKSYPTSSQQAGLVRISDLNTHFFDLNGVGKTMVLGCHDLTMFNPRSKNAKGWRMKVNEQFKELSRKEKPICVLHHPHTTVKTRTWLNAWSCLRKTLLSVKQYAGAGRYFESDRDRSDWDPLNDVLESTKCGNTMDFIV